jgi:putative glutathione S-transferase
MLNDDMNEFAEHPSVDFAPAALRPAIDAVNAKTYEDICNGVYKCGFAQGQEAYEAAHKSLFSRLDEVDSWLGTRRYLVEGSTGPTEADVRLFVCLVRFDEVYVVHFKCSGKAIREYSNLSGWLKDVYQTLNLAPTVNMRHIKHHYYRSHTTINRYGIVPVGSGTEAALAEPHGRDRPY